MKRMIVILCCMFALGIVWTSIFGLPGAPPKREITRKFAVRPVVTKEEQKAVKKEVAEPGAICTSTSADDFLTIGRRHLHRFRVLDPRVEDPLQHIQKRGLDLL